MARRLSGTGSPPGRTGSCIDRPANRHSGSRRRARRRRHGRAAVVRSRGQLVPAWEVPPSAMLWTFKRVMTSNTCVVSGGNPPATRNHGGMPAGQYPPSFPDLHPPSFPDLTTTSRAESFKITEHDANHRIVPAIRASVYGESSANGPLRTASSTRPSIAIRKAQAPGSRNRRWMVVSCLVPVASIRTSPSHSGPSASPRASLARVVIWTTHRNLGSTSADTKLARSSDGECGCPLEQTRRRRRNSP